MRVSEDSYRNRRMTPYDSDHLAEQHTADERSLTWPKPSKVRPRQRTADAVTTPASSTEKYGAGRYIAASRTPPSASPIAAHAAAPSPRKSSSRGVQTRASEPYRAAHRASQRASAIGSRAYVDGSNETAPRKRVGPEHRPRTHWVPSPQTMPHVPQFARSLNSTAHAPGQGV